MTLNSDIFTAPLTGDMDIVSVAVGAAVFALIAIVALLKLQKINKRQIIKA